MLTPPEYNEATTDKETVKNIWLSRIEQAKSNLEDFSHPAQKKSLQSALLEVYRGYYDFLTDSGFEDEAKKLLASHPDIELTSAAAA